MAYHFFADIQNLNIQTVNAFGPSANSTINTIENENFLVTSKHTATADTNAIAVCNGQILVQQQTENSELLNIVFKPLPTQPFNFPKIKYFIYKGIKKDSLIAATTTVLAAKGNNDLVDAIWAAFETTNTTGSPSQAILGLDTAINNLPESQTIEDVFSTIYPEVQFWHINAGNTIGKFDKDAIGFEIVLDTLFYQPTLALARNSATFIRAKTLSTTPLQKDFFEHWNDKESILNFIDPCAFFGSFYADKLSVISASQKSKWKGEDLYNNLLSKFSNKNKCYIDIRNEFNFSLNYFKNYGLSPTNNFTEIKIKKGDTAFASIDYYANSWPILILDNTDFATSTANHQSFSLQLPSGNGDNPEPIIYFSKAYNNSDTFPDEYDKQEKFKPLAVANNFSDEFNIGLPWINGNLISSYVQIKYCKRKSEEVLPLPLNTQMRKGDNFDCLFSPKINFNYNNSLTPTKFCNESFYIDLRTIHGYDAVFVPSISFDLDKVILFANLDAYNENTTKKYLLPFELNSEFKNVNTDFKFIDNLILKYQNQPLSEIGDNVLITFTHPQWSTIIGYNEFEGNYPVFISIVENRLENINNQSYTVFDIILKGYKINGNKIEVTSHNLNFNIYSLNLN